MKKFGALFFSIILLSPVLVSAQSMNPNSKLIALLTQLVQTLEAEIQQILAQQALQAPQVTQIPPPVFGSTQATTLPLTSTPSAIPSSMPQDASSSTPPSNAPTCTLVASSTPDTGDTLAWISHNATSGVIYPSTGTLAGGVRIYHGNEESFPVTPVSSGYRDDFAPNWYYKATFTGPGGSIDCYADVTSSPYWISQHG